LLLHLQLGFDKDFRLAKKKKTRLEGVQYGFNMDFLYSGNEKEIKLIRLF
jgi:hypothetical protein